MTSQEEERYFREEFARLRAEKRRAAEASAEKLREEQELRATIGSSDETLIAAVRALGLDSDTVQALEILPLIAVAWADGEIQSGEKIEILRVMTERGIADESEAHHFVEALLEERPSDAYINDALDLINVLHQRHGESASSLLQLCENVARASGGLFGGKLFRPVDESEQKAIDAIESKLSATGREALDSALSSS